MFELHDDGSVTLRFSSEDAAIVGDLMRTGRYATPGDVVVAALGRVAAERRWHARIEAEIAEGRSDLHTDRTPGTVDVLARMRARIEARIGPE